MTEHHHPSSSHSCSARKHPAMDFIFSIMFLFLTIQMVGMTAAAASQEMFEEGPGVSSRVPMKLNRNKVALKRQRVRNPVERETNFWNIFP